MLRRRMNPRSFDQLLQAQEGVGHCLSFDTLDELKRYWGVDHVVLSKLPHLINLERDGSAKHRLIWDLRSEPRLEDAVENGKHLLQVQDALEWLVVDVAHAFHTVPIRPSERQFMCGKVRTRFLVFKVVGMGGKLSPDIWGLFAAATGRVVSSVFSDGEFRCEVNVDDRLLAAGGSLPSRPK